jgi:hypothetical protein
VRGFESRDLVKADEYPSVGFGEEVIDLGFSNGNEVRIQDIVFVATGGHDFEWLERRFVEKFFQRFDHKAGSFIWIIPCGSR